MDEPKELVSDIERVVFKVAEEHDKFIFSILSRYCGESAGLEVDKGQLITAVLKQRAQKPEYVAGRVICPACGSMADAGKFDGRDFENHYCAKCGQKIDFKGET